MTGRFSYSIGVLRACMYLRLNGAAKATYKCNAIITSASIMYVCLQMRLCCVQICPLSKFRSRIQYCAPFALMASGMRKLRAYLQYQECRVGRFAVRNTGHMVSCSLSWRSYIHTHPIMLGSWELEATMHICMEYTYIYVMKRVSSTILYAYIGFNLMQK